MVQVGPRPGADEALALAPAPPAPEPEYRTEPRRRPRYTLEMPIDPEYLPFLGLMLVGLVLRFWDLGAKAFHHDESLHAFYSWRLYDGQGYVHDPMMHGPLLFELNALAYLLFGASDFTARLVPALLGTAIIGMPYFLRHELGRAAPSPPSLLFVISPAFLYFSRFIRHDIYVDAFTLLMVIGVFRYLATGNRPWFYTACRLGRAPVRDQGRLLHQRLHRRSCFLVGCWFLLKGERARAVPCRVRALGVRPWVIGGTDLPGHQPAAVHDVPDQPAGRLYRVRHAAAQGLRGADGRAQLLVRASRTTPAAGSPGSTTSCCCRCTSSCRSSLGVLASLWCGRDSCSSGSAPSGSSPRC